MRARSVDGRVHPQARRGDRGSAVLLRSDALSRLPADHERRCDGRAPPGQGRRAVETQDVPAHAGAHAQGIAFLFRYQQVSAQSNARYSTLSPASTTRPRPSASSTPSLAPPPLQTAGRHGPSIRSPAKTARSSRSCSPVSAPCTASPIATSDQSSDGLHSLSPKSQKATRFLHRPLYDRVRRPGHDRAERNRATGDH